MNRIQYPPVYAGLAVLLITSIAAIVGARREPSSAILAILFWAVLYGTGIFCGWRFNQNNSPALRNVTNAVAGVVLLLFMLMLFSAGFENAFVFLLIGLQASRNFTLATRRDFYYSYVISLIFILYAASLSRNALFLVYIVVYVLAGMFTLMADHIDDTLFRAKGGDREILLRRMSLPVKGTGLAVSVIGLSVVLYLLVPRPPSPRVQAFPSGGGWTYSNDAWERQAQQEERRNSTNNGDSPDTDRAERDDPIDSANGNMPQYAGFQERYDISAGSKKLPDDIVFYAQADRPFYARAKVFDLFDGRTWSVGRKTGRKIRNDDGFKLDKGSAGLGTGQTYYIEADMPPYLLAEYRPITVWFPGGAIHQNSDYSLRAPSFLRKGTIYSVLSLSREMNGRPVSIGENAGDLYRYLQIPDNMSLRVKELGKTVTQNVDGPLAKAEAIESFLKNNFFYTLNTAFRQPGSDAIDSFLFETKQGHCEYFASSMIVMLRTVNIPARLATGYVVYQKNAITGYYEVRQNHAHAWVEAYIGGYGWMSFEPTSTYQLPHPSKRIFAASDVFTYMENRLSQAARNNPESWWAQAFRKMLDFFTRFWKMLKGFFNFLWTIGTGFAAWFLAGGWMIMALILAVATLVHLALNRLIQIGEKIDLLGLRKKDERRFILECYRAMEKTLSRKKLPRRPFLSPSEYIPVVAAHSPHLAASLEVMTGSFNRARYSSFHIGRDEADSVLEAYRYIMEHIDKKPGQN